MCGCKAPACSVRRMHLVDKGRRTEERPAAEGPAAEGPAAENPATFDELPL